MIIPMSQNIEDIKIICPDCLGYDVFCHTCDGKGLIVYSDILEAESIPIS